jgi:hypothetical protein
MELTNYFCNHIFLILSLLNWIINGWISIKIEIIDKLVDAINVEIFVIEENERAKSRQIIMFNFWRQTSSKPKKLKEIQKENW